MATVLLTGATGFVGRHLTRALRAKGHSIVAVGRSLPAMNICEWLDGTTRIEGNPLSQSLGEIVGSFSPHGFDWLVHLAWNEVGNNRSLDHFGESLAGSWRFIRSCLASGINKVMVSGTCLEYGMQSGEMHACGGTDPVTAYGIAKDTLRRQLQCLQSSTDFHLVWARIFYMWGEGQSSRSLLPSLDRAIIERHAAFPMSGGEQQRDFIHAPEAARQMASLIMEKAGSGTTIANICSGAPVTVRHFVENHLKDQPWAPRLDLGAIPYADNEPMVFWGNTAPCKVQP